MRSTSTRLALLTLVASVVAGPSRAHEGQATPAISTLPPAEAPFGLGSATLPDDQAEVTALFSRLPAEIDGQPRSRVPGGDAGRVVASYGEPDPMFGPPLALQAMSFEEGDFFPRDFTADRFVASAAETADYGAQTFGQDGDLAWVQAETTAGVAGDRPGTRESTRPVYTLAWGSAASPWLFTAAASTPEGLDALVTAFVMIAASGSSTASPVASPATGA